ncbi:MAG TPA: type II 3-dehydroquinate dehydratase [Candidatus Dormibacteraeota bacterium]|jgi:3-dehydroquinate dehydratase-2|nr:type II 3-dehydroquinate dehydratase [Candidatus Dormibacteraeota bacterium]
MTRVLVLNGPNLGSLGTREPEVYGSATLADIEAMVRDRAGTLGIEIRWEQSNHEGALIDILEEERQAADACILNGGALTHTSIALADAVRGFGKPVVEVHISNIHAREPFRHASLTAAAARGVIAGLGPHGYVLALHAVAHMVGARGITGGTA